MLQIAIFPACSDISAPRRSQAPRRYVLCESVSMAFNKAIRMDAAKRVERASGALVPDARRLTMSARR